MDDMYRDYILDHYKNPRNSGELPGATNTFQDTNPLQNELFDRFKIEVPVMIWPSPPKRILRVSAHLYNTIDEYERLASVLLQLL